jgi:GTP cyclohydrolase I
MPVSPVALSSSRREEAAHELSGVSFEALVQELLRRLGESPEREGLRDTPERVRKSLEWLTGGMAQGLEDIVGDALFHETGGDMVLVKGIEFYSLCEHHMLPFFGKVHIAYVPDGRVIGLSKLPRLVEVFSRRLQVQERMTGQVADAVEQVLRPLGVGVITQASHLCMMMRGIKNQGATTTSLAMRGVFREDRHHRDELLRLVGP